jgi:hypothetical protein
MSNNNRIRTVGGRIKQLDFSNDSSAIQPDDLYQGTIDCSTNPNYPIATKNMYWIVSVAGKIGGSSGIDVEVGDNIICTITNGGGTHAHVGADFFISQVNINPSSVAELRTGTSNSTYLTPKVLKDQGITMSAATIMALAGGTTQQLLLTNTGTQHGLTIAGSTTGDGILISGSTGYSIAITGTTVTGIEFAGAISKGINFANSALSAGQENAMIAIGTWSTPLTVSAQTEHFVPIQVNLSSNTSVAKNIAAARFRVDTAVANTLTPVYALQTRNTIAHNVASAYGINASMNFGTVTIGSGAVAVISAYLEGTGTITPAGANPIDVFNATNVHSGTGVTNVLNVCNNTASAVTNVTTFSNLAGPVTNMIYVNNSNVSAYGINIVGSFTGSAIAYGTSGTPITLVTNPGSTVMGSTVNLLHSAGEGDCDDLLASYCKVAVTGSGDSGLTIVGSAPRAYVGVTGGANNSVASVAYASQPWAKHEGTGAITAMSALSALLNVGADNFTASTVNAGHFHITGASTVTGQFDGVMIEVYPGVTSIDSFLAMAADGGSSIPTAIRITGAATVASLFTVDAETASMCVAPNTSAINALTAKVAIKVITNTGTYWIPAFSCTDATGSTFN